MTSASTLACLVALPFNLFLYVQCMRRRRSDKRRSTLLSCRRPQSSAPPLLPPRLSPVAPTLRLRRRYRTDVALDWSVLLLSVVNVVAGVGLGLWAGARLPAQARAALLAPEQPAIRR